MRIYQNFPEAFNEAKRDLKEMGVSIAPQTVHDKDVSNNTDYATKELMNYGYTVVNPRIEDIPIEDPEWNNLEWDDRRAGINGRVDMLGTAWDTHRDKINWSEMLEVCGEPLKFGDNALLTSVEKKLPLSFSYTYGERLNACQQVWQVIKRLRVDRSTRQAYISIWDPTKDPERLGKRRIPCTLGYHFMYREGGLNITYTMRSCEFGTHFHNDVYFATLLQRFIADECQLPYGRFTHFINSFHCYNRNLSGVF